MIGGGLQESKQHQHNGPAGYPDQGDKTNKLFTWPWEVKGWPFGDNLWKPWQKPEAGPRRWTAWASWTNFPSIYLITGLGCWPGRWQDLTQDRIHRLQMISALPATGQRGAERKDFYPGYCRSQNTFHAAAPSLHPHELLSNNWFPKTLFWVGYFFVVVLGWVFFSFLVHSPFSGCN